MKSVLITGSNRGLGLGMVKYLLSNKNPPAYVIATCRKPDEAKDLKELAKNHKNLYIYGLDLLHTENFSKIVQKVEMLTENEGLNLLINNGGISTKFTTLNYVKAEQLIENFAINTMAPIMLTKAFLPLLKTAAEKNSRLPMSVHRAAVINMSSILGSIALNDKGGFYPYRCSKSALNAATKSMSMDLKKDGILTVAMHPGWVKTDMGGKQAPLDVDTSINSMFVTLQKLTEEDTGSFYQYDGKKLQW